ncbi:hypothetical protein [uncultured Metabacillus sp.]|uniref:hypothetical protein n=1 Tax=uncultured Metabacillus sp. TaxID=2860135 RepID=UPI00262FFB22|nr:hypothetical protein [uncultured Metabacillus sp.]
METFLEFLREVLKGIVREVSAYFFRKNVLENEKTTRAVTSKRVVLKENNFLTTTTLTVEAVKRSVRALLFFIIFLLYTI